MDHKPTLEELKELRNKTNEKESLEYQRHSLALNLNICPECGGELRQGFLGTLFSYKKCSKCGTKFQKMVDYTGPY